MKPRMQALILADHIYQDKATGKRVIAGVFNKILIRKQRVETDGDEDPHVEMTVGFTNVSQPYAYVSVTDIRGETDLSLRYVDLKDHQVLMRAELKVNSHDPLETLELSIPLPALPAPHAGVYALEIVHKNEPLGSLRVTAIELEGDDNDN